MSISDPRLHLLPSRSIEIQVEGKNQSLKTLVEQGIEDGRFRVIAPIHEGKLYLFQKGERIEVIYSFQEGNTYRGYSIPCEVLKKERVDELPVVLLEVRGEPKSFQRRRAFRVNLVSRMYFISDDRNADVREMFTRDFSLTGLMGRTRALLKAGDRVRLLWQFEEPNYKVSPMKSDGMMDFFSEGWTVPSVEQFFQEDEPEFENRPFQSGKNHRSFDVDLNGDVIEPEDQEKTEFVIKATVHSVNYVEEDQDYEVRLQFDKIGEKRSKQVLRYLYRKQAEEIQSNPEISNRIEQFFASSGEPAIPAWISALTLGSLFLMLISLIFFMLAKPTDSYSLDLFFKQVRSVAWDIDSFRVSFYLLLGASAVELVSFLAKLFLAIRRVHRFRLTWIMLLAFEFLALYGLLHMIEGNALVI